jgi:hypothetical protein
MPRVSTHYRLPQYIQVTIVPASHLHSWAAIFTHLFICTSGPVLPPLLHTSNPIPRVSHLTISVRRSRAHKWRQYENKTSASLSAAIKSSGTLKNRDDETRFISNSPPRTKVCLFLDFFLSVRGFAAYIAVCAERLGWSGL